MRGFISLISGRGNCQNNFDFSRFKLYFPYAKYSLIIYDAPVHSRDQVVFRFFLLNYSPGHTTWGFFCSFYGFQFSKYRIPHRIRISMHIGGYTAYPPWCPRSSFWTYFSSWASSERCISDEDYDTRWTHASSTAERTNVSHYQFWSRCAQPSISRLSPFVLPKDYFLSYPSQSFPYSLISRYEYSPPHHTSRSWYTLAH